MPQSYLQVYLDMPDDIYWASMKIKIKCNSIQIQLFHFAQCITNVLFSLMSSMNCSQNIFSLSLIILFVSYSYNYAYR